MQLLPFLTSDVPPIPGRARSIPEDFHVEEIPAYAPEGEGTHLFVLFEKTGLTTPRAVEAMARALGSDPRAAGYAGMKDKDAVTVQYASFERATAEAARALEIPGITIKDAALHRGKLRTGHLHGNRFTLRIRETPKERLPDVARVVERLAKDGVPNYYGEQRFGRDGDNAEKARAWLMEGGRAPRTPFERKLYASAFQSELFNRAVALRVSCNELGVCRHGDIVQKTESSASFVVEDVAEVQSRCDAWALSPTGPMFGPEMRWPLHDALTWEQALLEEAGLSMESLERLGRFGRGTRRAVRVRPQDLTLAETEDGFTLRFSLPAGSYATVVLREIFKQDAIAADRR